MKILPTLGLAVALGAAGCVASITPGGVPTIGLDIATIQADAVLACAYLPTASTIAAIISANNPLTITAEMVAYAICNAIGGNVVASRRVSATAVVIPQGLVIHGRYVGKKH